MRTENFNFYRRMKHYNVTGLSIAEIDDGTMKSAEWFGLLEAGTDNRVTRNSVFNACSISKFLTSILVLTLSERSILDLDEDINQKLLSWKVPYNELNKDKKVTLRHLLSHQSGVIDPEGSFFVFNSITGAPDMTSLLHGKTPYCEEPVKVSYKPGSEFHYSDAGFCIIQLLIEDVMEKPFQQVMNEEVFQHLKMKNSTFELPASASARQKFSCGHNRHGELADGKYPFYPYPAASGLWTTPSDLALLLIELMNSLKGNSKLNLSAKNANEMIVSQGCKEWTGLGVFLDKNEKGIEISSLGWGIGFQCMLAAYPNLEKGLVIMTNTDSGVHQLKGLIGEIYTNYLF
ncbi:class A beta-lactamase-related serine hydrolase [Jeotgalibacillus sp. S-D1]|uniref:serine hydrolase domain-containing protein n=1 Tax=Jeotgalibacillus sp. S-D1 TaxID=2552189 RepID=UPI001059E3F9|nr:serine hydrolase domain-containing protein [Jeotgalibacillus sp. S-D1]TDL34278.1 class A beta-lactamase-related serine hydrolase [Jeotgalibacillus sp. S-D1]